MAATPESELLRSFGLAWTFHARPFQCSIKAWVPMRPTAQASRGEVAATAASPLDRSLGLRWTAHPLPFQCSISAPWTSDPTAQAFRADTATALSTPGPTFGVRMGAQLREETPAAPDAPDPPTTRTSRIGTGQARRADNERTVFLRAPRPTLAHHEFGAGDSRPTRECTITPHGRHRHNAPAIRGKRDHPAVKHAGGTRRQPPLYRHQARSSRATKSPAPPPLI